MFFHWFLFSWKYSELFTEDQEKATGNEIWDLAILFAKESIVVFKISNVFSCFFYLKMLILPIKLETCYIKCIILCYKAW